MIQVPDKGGPNAGSILTVPAEKVILLDSSVGAHCLKMDL